MAKKIVMEDVDVNNLSQFLGRVKLKGVEVPAYIRIINAIANAKEEEGD